jgi:hypothetical protein
MVTNFPMFMMQVGPEGYLALAVLALAITAVVLAVKSGMRAQRIRANELSTWAAANNLSFSADKQYLDNAYLQFNELCRGCKCHLSNVIKGTYRGRAILAFDCHREDDGNNQNWTSAHKTKIAIVSNYSAIIITSPVPLKPFSIHPESLLDKLGELAGVDRIKFESQEFNRRFAVRSPDKKWAYDILTQQTMQFLLASPAFHIRLDGMCIFIWNNKLFSAADYMAACNVVDGIIKRLPNYLVQDQKLITE